MKISTCLKIISIEITVVCLMCIEGTLLNNNEDEILRDLVEHFQVRHLIFVKDFTQPQSQISNFKRSFAMKTYITFMPAKYMIRVLLFVKKYSTTRTMIIYKSGINISFMNQYMSLLKSKKALNRMSQFIWLMFTNKPTLIPRFEYLVPYDCEFFIVYPFGSRGMKIQKVHSLGDGVMHKGYEKLSNGRYNFSGENKYPAKADMNRTVFITKSLACSEVRTVCRIFLNETSEV